MQDADPTDALAMLGDETRIEILRTLADADEPLPFSELRQRAGVDDAGRFNYHLSKLREYFVREEGGGYTLRHAGSRVIAAAGVADQSGTGREPTAAEVDGSGSGDSGDDECPVCGEENCERLFHVHLSAPWR